MNGAKKSGFLGHITALIRIKASLLKVLTSWADDLIGFNGKHSWRERGNIRIISRHQHAQIRLPSDVFSPNSASVAKGAGSVLQVALSKSTFAVAERFVLLGNDALEQVYALQLSLRIRIVSQAELTPSPSLPVFTERKATINSDANFHSQKKFRGLIKRK